VLTALQEVTRTIPIVFAQVADPLANGYVASLARPGGNMTGFALYEVAIGVKWLELLKEIAPRVTRVATIHDPTDLNSKYVHEIESVAPSLGVQVSASVVSNVAELERAIEGFAKTRHRNAIFNPDELPRPHTTSTTRRSAGCHRLGRSVFSRAFRAGGIILSARAAERVAKKEVSPCLRKSPSRITRSPTWRGRASSTRRRSASSPARAEPG
jgi:putative ABC transport system substrate-binding protein